MFMAQMLQPMFNTVGVNKLFGGGHGEEAMRGFLVQEYGKTIAKGTHFGIAEAVRTEMQRAQQKTNRAKRNRQTMEPPMLPDRFSRKPASPATPPLVVSIISLMNELIDIMAAEPELVMGRKFEAHKLLLKRKQRLAMDYRASIKSIAAQPDMLKQLPEDTRRALKSAAQKLAEAAERNARTLRAAVTAVQRLIQNIIAFVKSEMLVKPGYKNPKTAHLELGTYSPTCKPVAVRRSA